MVKAELRRLRSTDVIDLEHYSPEEPDNFRILIDAVVGPLGGKGEESFEFVVCTPKWLEQEVQSSGPLFGKARILIKEYNYDQLFTLVDELCSRITGENWETIEYKLRRYGDWEYEDDRPG